MDKFQVPLVTSQFRPTPRLSLAHLFVWTTLCAICLGVMRMAWGAYLNVEYVLELTVWIAVSILHGTALGYPATKLMYWYEARRRQPFISIDEGPDSGGLPETASIVQAAIPSYPGEFLWRAEAVLSTCSLAASGITRILYELRSPLMGFWNLTAPILAIAVFFWTAASIRDVPWRRFCFLIVVLEGLGFLSFCVIAPSVWFSPRLMTRVAGAIVLAFVAGKHWRAGPLPWTHWVGVSTFFGNAICAVAYIVAALSGL